MKFRPLFLFGRKFLRPPKYQSKTISPNVPISLGYSRKRKSLRIGFSLFVRGQLLGNIKKGLKISCHYPFKRCWNRTGERPTPQTDTLPNRQIPMCCSYLAVPWVSSSSLRSGWRGRGTRGWWPRPSCCTPLPHTPCSREASLRQETRVSDQNSFWSGSSLKGFWTSSCNK